MKWNKHIKLKDARKLSELFCKSFNIDYCQIYYVDILKESNWYAVYCGLEPPHILIIEKIPNPLGILVHELTHHLENELYNVIENECPHGYNYILARKRVIRWCNKNISSKPDWSIPLGAYHSLSDMKKFRV